MCCSGCVLAAWAGRGTLAQDSLPPADKWRYDLFTPTPRGQMRPLSPDRPDTTESPFTVDAGHFQIELTFVDFLHDSDDEQQQTRRTVAVAPMLLKVGVLNNVDLQLGLAWYTRERITDRPSGTSETADGFGDVLLRLKCNLWGNDAFKKPGDTALAVMPFIKFPAADAGLGNGNIEGGVMLPFAVQLPKEFSLGCMAECDINRDEADDRYVVDFVHTVTLGRPLWGDLGAYVEYAGFVNLNADAKYRGFLDTGLIYNLTDDVQLDGGIRVGVTDAADDFAVFVGLTKRF